MDAFGDRVVHTRFVPDEAEPGRWSRYYDRWPTMRQPASSQLWDLTVPAPPPGAGHAGREGPLLPAEDERWACQHVPRGEVRVIPGVWGHFAGGGANPDDVAFIDRGIRDLLAQQV